ncbi:hypothetical protein P3T23_005145 [Paraburkholderia sp. GAS448]
MTQGRSLTEAEADRREIGGTLAGAPNASTCYQDTSTGVKLHFAVVECHAT